MPRWLICTFVLAATLVSSSPARAQPWTGGLISFGVGMLGNGLDQTHWDTGVDLRATAFRLKGPGLELGLIVLPPDEWETTRGVLTAGGAWQIPADNGRAPFLYRLGVSFGALGGMLPLLPGAHAGVSFLAGKRALLRVDLEAHALLPMPVPIFRLGAAFGLRH
jgi:hypothetical protein